MKKAFGFGALIVVAVVYSVSLPQAKAQAVFGSILGTVSDPQGAAVAGAQVTVTDQSKGTVQETTTNESGNYSVTHLVPDAYSIRVEAKGFKTSEQKDVSVAADTGVRVDLGLQLGATTESIEVTGEVPQLKTDRADVAVEFNSRAIENLPVLNRNFTNFELLTPGTQKLGWSHAATENPQGGGQIFVNGQHFSGTGFELDGTDNQDPILGIIVINPNLDAVTEAKVSTADFDAEFGKAIAGLVTVQTKSGSNELHGSGFYFRRSSANEARDPFTQWAAAPGIAASPVPSSKWQQFGGSLGGPIIKNKLFFFGDYQGTRQSSGVTNLITIPTARAQSSCNPATNAASATPGFCDLSDYLGPQYGTGGQVFVPGTSTQFAGNLIPIGQISPQAANILALFPAPNNAGSNPVPGTSIGTANNFLAAGSGPYNQNAFDTRIDFSASSTIQVFGRFSLDYFSLSGKGSLGALGGVGFGPGGLAGSSIVHNYSLATGVTKTLSSSLLTDFRFGYFKYNPNTHKPDEGSTPMTAFGIPNANLGDRFTSGLGQFNFNGNAMFGDGLGVARCNCPLIESEQQFQFVNNWTKTHGNHTFKFGADVRFAENLRVPSDSNRTGVYDFKDATTSNAGSGGLALATFLLGDVTDLSRYVSTSTNAAERQWRMFYYGEDSWRFTPKLTINLGLRWEVYFPEYVNAKGNGGFANIVQGVDRVGGFGPYGLNGNIAGDWHAFAPRVGIAYQLREKTVIRMGYGRSYDMGVFGSNFGHAVTQNLPVLAAQFQQNTNQFLPTFTLAAGPPPFVFPAIPSNGQLPLAGPQCTFGTTFPGGVPTPALCIQPHIRPTSQRLPYVDTWNATVQHQLTRTMSLEVTYLGNKGTHGFVGDGPTYNVNQPGLGVGQQGTFVNGVLMPCGTYAPSTTPSCSFIPNVPQVNRRPFYNAFTYPGYPDSSNTAGSQPGVLQCCFTDQGNYLGNDASSYYNALTVKLDRRFSNGLQFMTFYNYAKGYHYDSNFYVDDKAIAHGPDDNLRNHQWVTSLIYQLPFGKGKSFGGDVGRGMDAVIGGWQIAGTITWAGGLPWTPGLSGAVCNLEQDTGVCRPNKGTGSFNIGAGSFVHDARGHYVQFFTPVTDTVDPTTGVSSLPSGNGFSDPGLNNIGNHGYDSFRGPRYFGADAVLSKSFTLTERAKLEFRMDVYNLFNHPILGFNQNQGGSGTCIDCSGNGRVTDIENDSSPGSPNGMRQLQFGLRLDF